MSKDPKKEKDIKKETLVGLKNKQVSENMKSEDLYLQRAFEDMEADLSLPSDEIFHRICTRIIHEEEENPVKENIKKAEGLGAGLLERIRGLFNCPSLAWGFCAAQFVVFVFAFFMLNSSKPRFETMSYGQNSNHKQVFNVIFKKNVKFEDVVSFLQKHHMIINGPLGKDLFVIEIKNKKDIEGLKKSGILEFMEKAY